MYVYIVYGVACDELSTVKSDLEKVLNVEFELHESSYWGEYYIRRLPDFGEIRVGYNYVDEDWRERNFREYPVLIELNELENLQEVMKAIKEKLPYAKLIRKKELVPKGKSRIKRKEYLFINDKPLLISEQELKKLF
ncbi:MAG: hypothetical protein WB502_08175 [Thermoactinomyces sp.]